MKFTGALLALCAVPAAAFYVQSPKFTQTSPLHSFSYDPNRSAQGMSTVPGASVGTGSSIGPMVPDNKGGALGGGAASSAKMAEAKRSKTIWDTSAPITVQGGSLRTWSFADPSIERLQVFLKTEGRPLNANVELWHGPDNTPQKMAVHLEDGSKLPFSCVIETPRGHNAIAIRNTGHLEFPLQAAVVEDAMGAEGLGPVAERLSQMSADKKTIQGGAIKTYSFTPAVASVQVLLKTDGRPLNARIELLQGPNNDKQVVELYTEDGLERPFYMVIDTPGVGNVVRIVNTATVEFPLTAAVEPYLVEDGYDESEARGWDNADGVSIMNRPF